MPGTHSNAVTYRRIVEDAARGARPVIHVILSTSRATTNRGGWTNHYWRNFGPMRGGFVWAGGNNLNHAGAGDNFTTIRGAGSSALTWADQAIAQAEGWQFFSTPHVNGAALYKASGSLAGNPFTPVVPGKTMRRTAMEFTIVDRTFASGSGLYRAQYKRGTSGDPSAGVWDLTTNTGAVSTRYTRTRLTFSETGVTSSIFVNGIVGPCFIIGCSVRDPLLTGGFYEAMLCAGGSRNQRHAIDELVYAVGQQSVIEYLRTLATCCGGTPIFVFAIEYGVNVADSPTALSPATEDATISRTFGYNASSGAFASGTIDLTGWRLTFLNQAYANTNGADFPTRTVSSYNTGTNVATYSDGALPSMSGWTLVRGTPPGGSPSTDAQYRIAMRQLVQFVRHCATEAGYESLCTVTPGNADPNLGATVNARRDLLIAEFATTDYVTVLDMGPDVVSTATLAGWGVTDYVHPSETAFGLLYDAVWTDILAQTTTQTPNAIESMATRAAREQLAQLDFGGTDGVLRSESTNMRGTDGAYTGTPPDVEAIQNGLATQENVNAVAEAVATVATAVGSFGTSIGNTLAAMQGAGFDTAQHSLKQLRDAIDGVGETNDGPAPIIQVEQSEMRGT